MSESIEKQLVLPAVLVVDDQERNRIVMNKILKELPITVCEATSGEEALSCALRQDFAVIYLDIQMPGMDGYEVAECLSQSEQTAHIPIVFITAIYPDEDNIKKAYQAGAIDFLSKPINSLVLLSKTKVFTQLFTERKELEIANQKLEEIANVDALTNLANRHQFRNFSQNILKQCKRVDAKFAMLMLDLDNFKIVNDTLGHDQGDILLVEMAKRLTSSTREVDFIARIGGDEFIIIVTDVKATKDVTTVAKKISKTLSQPFPLQDKTFQPSASIGIACYPMAGEDINELMKAADIALYRAKKKGKNTFEFFSESLNKEYQARQKMEDALLVGLENNEFYLYYQPQYDLESAQLSGIEVLARWSNSVLGEVSPGDFVPLAEEVGKIQELSGQIFQMALEQFKIWQDNYPDMHFHMAINLSPLQLVAPDFVSTLKGWLSIEKLNLSRLHLELTESFFSEEMAQIKEVLGPIQDMGVKFAIDDFGTGYSSLSRLKELSIDIVKIDQSFIRDISTDDNDAAIVKAIIALAEALQLKVVAEGVETKEQVDFLKQHQCDLAQGFFFAKPMGVRDMDTLLKKLSK